MKKGMAEAKEPIAGHHLVLAAALAETGQFDEAVKTQEKAIALLPKENPKDREGNPFTSNARLKPMYEERLKLYQEKKPYRMAPRRGGGAVKSPRRSEPRSEHAFPCA